MGKDKKGNKPEQPQGPQGPTGPVSCIGPDCKQKAKRFSFCTEHYDQFKFGLINKEGGHAKDYEKKLEHYEAYKQRQKDRKAA